MLQTIRSHSGSWFIKFLLAGIIASFALWGIADIIRGYGANRPVAQVGKASISVEEFAHAYKQAINNLQERFKGALTPEQIKEFNVGEKVLDNLIEKEILAQDIKAIELVISDSTVTNEIRSIPAFVKKDGTFDIEKFNAVLQTQGMHEKRFIQEMRADLQQFQLFEGLTSGFEISDEYLTILHNALEQPFHFVALDIPLKKMAIKAPAEAELLAFYETHKESFKTPELRTVTVLKLNRDTLMSKVILTNEDLKEEYDRRVNEFTTDEKRTIKQLTLTSPDQFQQVETLLAAGKPVPAIARELNITSKSFDDVTKSGFGADAEAVFALELGKPSKMIDASNGWIVYVVEKISPSVAKPFEAVRAELEANLKIERFNDFFENLQKQIEDALAGGSTFKEISEKFSLPLQMISGLNKSGKDAGGKPMIEEGVAEELLEFTFANNQGSDSPVIMSKAPKDNLLAVIAKIEQVAPSHTPEFSLIKGQVSQAYTMEMQNKLAQKLADEASKNVKSLGDLKKFAASKGLSVNAIPAVSRANVDQNQSIRAEYTMDTVERMFSLSKGEALPTQTKHGFKVIMIDHVENVKMDKEKFLKFKQAMHEMYKRDFKEGYKNHLKTIYPVTINKAQVDHVVGIGA